MARPARLPDADDAPPVDPLAVQRAYRLERARRRARVERSRARKRASLRFFVVFGLLLAVAVWLTLTVREQLQQLFGL
jgi:hypothetical protein